ncbi:recombinase family protein [Natronococcus sp. A-GB7]|uniref:recombinase family protein n=1 Tax=Natronococcus sp. A-GB7 TaxID=3037649 RepID=UPI00241F12FE|nr:recombinase family protein [Natronococcus sp. A-GB7]MDG5821619.1 recombinase family protein [Natronococcus sp. A-GB7]
MNYATYIRASTDDQTDIHQRESIDEWIRENDIDLADVDRYVDLGQSGASDDREQFTELLEAIEAGEYTHIICWEISRLSRKGATLQRFFDVCEDTETTVVITDGSVEKVTPDGTGRFVADIIGMVYQQERRTLIRRIEAGQRRAQRQGKWLGQVPAGFRRDDEGYLQPIIDPDHNVGDTGYLELRDALERIDDGESYRSVAEGLPITRQSLSNIYQDSERRKWYLEATADNDAVHAALESVQTAPVGRNPTPED